MSQPNGAIIIPGPRVATDDAWRTGWGAISASFHPGIASTGQAPVSQTIYAVACGYRAGQIVTNIGWGIQQAASGTTPTGIFCGLANASTLLMDSANVASSTAWTTTGMRTVALSSPYAIPTTGLYYHLFLLNGSFGTTALQIYRAAGLASSDTRINATGSGHLWATAGTGQTALPAVNGAVTLSTSSAFDFFTFST